MEMESAEELQQVIKEVKADEGLKQNLNKLEKFLNQQKNG